MERQEQEEEFRRDEEFKTRRGKAATGSQGGPEGHETVAGPSTVKSLPKKKKKKSGNINMADARAYCEMDRQLEAEEKRRQLEAEEERRQLEEGEERLELHVSAADKRIRDPEEHRRWLESSAAARKKMSCNKIRKNRPNNPAIAQNPILTRACWTCGRFQENCQVFHASVKCVYPLCSKRPGDVNPHDTSVCRSLHHCCNKCLMRGHRPEMCGDDGNTPARKKDRRDLFESYADLGVETKKRCQNVYLGAFYFKRGAFKKLKKPNLGYLQMMTMTVEEVQKWIREYKFPGELAHEKLMFTSKKRDGSGKMRQWSSGRSVGGRGNERNEVGNVRQRSSGRSVGGGGNERKEFGNVRQRSSGRSVGGGGNERKRTDRSKEDRSKEDRKERERENWMREYYRRSRR
jgi:hypothetical protein